jgi:hypothetical protein
MVGEKRHQVKSELKRVLDLIRVDQSLGQGVRSHDFAQVLAALEAAKEVEGNTYLKAHLSKVIDQVERILQNGPALLTLEGRQADTAEGDAA